MSCFYVSFHFVCVVFSLMLTFHMCLPIILIFVHLVLSYFAQAWQLLSLLLPLLLPVLKLLAFVMDAELKNMMVSFLVPQIFVDFLDEQGCHDCTTFSLLADSESDIRTQSPSQR